MKLGIFDFHSALKYVAELPYGRTSDNSNYRLVLCEEKGTCSSKHALIAKLCLEQNQPEFQLVLGIYQMSERTNPGVGQVLSQYDLLTIPEAHCFIRYRDSVIDITKADSSNNDPIVFTFEEVINPSQIGSYKIRLHKHYINKWIESAELPLNLDKAWSIRELCIEALGTSGS
jgi:hypothetical protein